jgi:hypothetical protein
MAIKVYQSQVSAAQIGGQRAATQGAPLRVQEKPLMSVALNAADNLSAAGLKKVQEEQEIQKAADLLDESNKYYEATRTFEQEYKLNKKGAEARDAVKDFEEFHRKQLSERSARFAGDPRSSLMWAKQASQIQMGSVNRGIGYSEQQDRVYRAEVTSQKTSLYFQKVAEAPNDKVVNNLRKQYNAEVRALNSQEVTDVLMAKADEETGVVRINTAIANHDVAEAKRLLKEYKEAGVLGKSTDDMINKVEAARVNDEAFKISQDIRALLPLGTKTEKLDKVKEMAGGDAEVYKAARYQVMQDHSDQEAVKKEQDQMIVDLYSSKIEMSKTPEERRDIETQIMSTPMREPIRTKLLGMNSQGLKQPLTSDENKLREVEQLVATEKITQEQLDREYKWFLSKQDYDLQTTRLKEEGGNRVNAYNLAMEDRLSKAFAEDGKKTRKVKMTRFKDNMNQFIKEFKTKNGHLPSDQDLSNQESWLLEKVIYDENWYGDSRTERFMIDTLDASKFDVPAAYKADISKQLKAASIEPTEERIIEIYRQYLLDKNND